MAAGGAWALPPLAEMRSCRDFEAAARLCLPEASWEYIAGGEADTILRNEADFGSLLFRPRVLNDVSSVNIQCSLFGTPCAAPFYLSSVAKGGLVAGRAGEAVFVRAAAKFGLPYLVPAISSLPLAKIWEEATEMGRLMPFQWYMIEDEEASMQSLQEALRLGARTIVATVDANAPRAGAFRARTGGATVGLFPSPCFTWSKLLALKSVLPSGVNLYLKGVQTAEDAMMAIQCGVQGIIVSNHGGRCCEGARSALACLEEVAGALRERGMLGSTELLYDSGVRSGRDALKALCLGARGVAIGRPYYWASAAYGEPGVAALLELLIGELGHAMAQVGAASLGALGPGLLCRASAPHRPLAPRSQPSGEGAGEAAVGSAVHPLAKL